MFVNDEITDYIFISESETENLVFPGNEYYFRENFLCSFSVKSKETRDVNSKIFRILWVNNIFCKSQGKSEFI